jgi:hypothetical protein
VLLSAARRSPRLAARASHLDDRVDADDDVDGIIVIDDVIATRIARRRREPAARSVDDSRRKVHFINAPLHDAASDYD